MAIVYQSWDPSMVPSVDPNACMVPCGVANTPGCNPVCGATQLTTIPGVSLNTVPPPVDTTPVSSGFDLSSIPMWGWLAVAGLGAYLLMGGHKH